jgi:four helix bundle protein
MSYRNLEIWKLARQQDIELHSLSYGLPRHQLYEIGSQIRRSAHSVRSNIVEGYGRRRYKQEYIKFLTYAIASNDETRDHLETLLEVGLVEPSESYEKLVAVCDSLGKQLNLFIRSVERRHQPPPEASS